MSNNFKTQLNTIAQVLKIAWKVNKKYFVFTALTGLAISFIPVASAYLLSELITAVSNGLINTNLSFVIALISTYTALLFIEGSSHTYYSTLIYFLYRYDIGVHFIDIVTKKVSELDIEYFEDPEHTAMMMKALDNYAYAPGEMLMESFEALERLTSMLFVLIALTAIFPLASLLIIIATLPHIWADYKFESNLWDMWSTDAETRRRYGRLLRFNDDYTYVKELRLLDIGRYFQASLLNLVTGIYGRQKVLAAKKCMALVLTSIISFAAIGFLIYIFAKRIELNNMEIGALAFFVSSLFNLKRLFSEMLFKVNKALTSANYIQVIFDFLAIKPKVVSKPDAVNILENPISIEFKNVSFKYPSTKRYILKNFNLKIDGKQKIAIVGENGAGKTTLIKLLLRFYDATKGEILINGINIKDIDISTWRKSCGVLLQDFQIFNLPSIEANIGLGNLSKFESEMAGLPDNETPNSITEAAKNAMAHKFISKHPNQYKEIVGRDLGGVDFSGGEMQRLALARTFYRNAGLIIMDEPTSAVDAKAEAEIFEYLKDHLLDKTVVFVSHRFSTVRNADRIIVIENGLIEEDGTHEELMQKDKTYKKLFTLQAKGYQ